MIREVQTEHRLELLTDGVKGLFCIENYLGGTYYLTADEVYTEGDYIVIQESKNNSRGKLPSKNDILDGLFKLIIFENLDKLEFAGKTVNFKTRLKLTGNLKGKIELPAPEEEIKNFSILNNLSSNKTNLLMLLNKEAKINSFSVHIEGNKEIKNP